MKEGYIYIENNRPVWNAERKPEPADYLLGIAGPDNYKKVLKEWQKSCIEIDNAGLMDDEDPNPIIAVELSDDLENVWLFFPGQKAFIDGQTIVKLG